MKKESIEAFMHFRARKALGIPQDMMAGVLGVNRAQISLMESRRGRLLPSKTNRVLFPIERAVLDSLPLANADDSLFVNFRSVYSEGIFIGTQRIVLIK